MRTALCIVIWENQQFICCPYVLLNISNPKPDPEESSKRFVCHSYNDMLSIIVLSFTKILSCFFYLILFFFIDSYLIFFRTWWKSCFFKSVCIFWLIFQRCSFVFISLRKVEDFICIILLYFFKCNYLVIFVFTGFNNNNICFFFFCLILTFF